MSKRLLIAFVIVDLLLGFAVYRGYQSWTARGEAQAIVASEEAAATALRDKGVTLFPAARPLVGFSLIDQAGAEFTETDLEGRWSLVFFGFTHCPDICPVTMKELAEFYAQLSDDERSKLNVILGTVDPERDDSQAMADYVAQYNEDFIGLTGDRSALSVLTKLLYVTYSDPAELETHEGHDEHEREQGADQVTDHTGHGAEAATPEDYLITHSGHIAIINPDGDFHGVIRPPHRDRDLLSVMRGLLAEGL